MTLDHLFMSDPNADFIDELSEDLICSQQQCTGPSELFKPVYDLSCFHERILHIT